MTRHSETMHRLEQARPDALRPSPDPARRERYLAMATSHPQAPPDGLSTPVPVPRTGRRARPPGASVLSRLPHRAALALGGGGLVVAAAAVVAVSLAVAGTLADPATEKPTQAGSAPALLLAAATRAEQVPANTPGRYWLARSEEGSLRQVGPVGNQYTLLIRENVDLWLSTSGQGPSGLVETTAGATPATPADEDAWRRDGSPTQWQTDGKTSFAPTLSATRGVVTSWVGQGPGWSLVTGGQTFSVAQFLALPTDPAALRAFLEKTFDVFHDPLASDREGYLYDAGTELLTTLPSTPALRGAVYRMLAGLPHVRNVGPLTLPNGTRGQAIAFTETTAAGTFDEILVFDPSTGAPAGTEERMIKAGELQPWIKPGTIFRYMVTTSAGWSDGTPPPRQFNGHPIPRHS